MKTPAFAQHPLWKNLYMAALFENDKSKIPLRIKDAEAEIETRARMLFPTSHDHAREAQALDNAFRMLQVLKRCLKAEEAQAS